MNENAVGNRATVEEIKAAREIYENSNIIILDTARANRDSSDGEELGYVWIEAWVKVE